MPGMQKCGIQKPYVRTASRKGADGGGMQNDECRVQNAEARTSVRA